MKKIIPIAICAMLLLSLCSCTGADDKNVALDADKLCKEVINSVSFDESLDKITDSAAMLVYDIPTGVETTVYYNSGATPEEISVFYCADAAAFDAMKTNVEQHIADQISGFEDYIPDEVTKLDNAVVKTVGSYIIVCVSDDPDASKKVDSAVNSSKV